MPSFTSSDCHLIMNELLSNPSCNCINKDRVNRLDYYCTSVGKEEVEERYSKPMVWIGIYIAVASVFCTLVMVADLLHGFRKRKLWFPCKYFTLNAASITLIAIAMKLPVDLSSPMSGVVDQTTKMGSMVFMCTMMANIMPSMASMCNKELFANVVGLVIFVITLIVNVLIQLHTGLLTQYFSRLEIWVFVGMTFSLLVILTSLAITTPTFKQILELKYQAAHKSALNERDPQQTSKSIYEYIEGHVRRYSVMAGTGSPQFVMAITPLCSVAGIICVSNAVMYFSYVLILYKKHVSDHYDSDYKWSMLMILITQSVGIAVGIIAPIFRCFAALNFKLSIKWSRNHIEVFKVEKYWTQKFSEWKHVPLCFPLGRRGPKSFLHTSKNLFLNLCIGLQKVVVVSSKMIGLVPIGVVIFVVYCLNWWKPSREQDTKDDTSKYVLQLQDEMELGKRTLERISNSVNPLIQNAEKQEPKYLLKLLEKSGEFKGVENQEPQISDEPPNSWSLSILNLTCITIALPSICNDEVNNLFKGVVKGLSYTHLVEENLNNADEFVNIHRATMDLKHVVKFINKWFENTPEKSAFRGKTSIEILNWFVDKAKEMGNTSTNREQVANVYDKSIVANSMRHIAETIIDHIKSNNEPIGEKKLFDILSNMIADKVVACLTNLPQVIVMECHESVIEKREASVEATTKLLGRTKKIIEKLPSLDPEQMAFSDKRRVHLKQSNTTTSSPSIACQEIGGSCGKGEENVQSE